MKIQSRNNIVDFYRAPKFQTKMEQELYDQMLFQTQQILEQGRLIQDQSSCIRDKNLEIENLKIQLNQKQNSRGILRLQLIGKNLFRIFLSVLVFIVK